MTYRAVAWVVALTACGHLPGRPDDADAATPVRFDTLYAANCAGCHGANGRNGASLSLNNPAYLAMETDSALREVTANGVRGTLMPAFSRRAGGSLADSDVDAIVTGIRAAWGKNAIADAPPKAGTLHGDSSAGAQAYATFCAGCHGATGAGGPHGGSVVDPSYLALVSDRWLRTVIVVGRPELGMPAGQAMTDRQVADVVAWLAAQRTPFPGQPYRSP